MGRSLPHAVIACCALALAACDQPPGKEIAAAEAALAQARIDQADAYAPDRYKEAEAALRAAKSKVEEKDYRGALSAAMDATEKSRAASQATASARVLARSAAEVALAELQAALEEVDAVREEARKAKVPEQAFAEAEPRIAEAREGVASVSETLASGRMLEAQKAALELKSRFGSLPAELREAMQKWQEEHPRGRRRAPPRRG
jgi:hypothetical protein